MEIDWINIIQNYRRAREENLTIYRGSRGDIVRPTEIG